MSANDTVIRVENLEPTGFLGKRYRIGALQERHDTFRDALMSPRWRSLIAGKRPDESALVGCEGADLGPGIR